ncbi:MAG TPA: carotenoid biosynthesis protein [Terriglobales bacterium]|nr:carotenoid biosynthesis protein [Terriglobales bacterium]
MPGGCEHFREPGCADRLPLWTLLLHGSYGAEAVRRSYSTWTRVSGYGLSFLGAGPSDFGRRANDPRWVPRCDPAFGCSIHHGRLGFSQDPVWSTILHLWIWRDGGAYFGVPVSNFLGWYLTVYVFYQLFALYLRGRSANPKPLPSSYWKPAVLFYAASAAGNVLLLVPQAGPSVVLDPSGAQWKVSDITGTCAVVSIFTMGAFTLLAWVRLATSRPKRNAGEESAVA